MIHITAYITVPKSLIEIIDKIKEVLVERIIKISQSTDEWVIKTVIALFGLIERIDEQLNKDGK